MIYYVTANDVLATLPASFDASTCNQIRILTESEPTVNCQHDVSVMYDDAEVASYITTIQLSQFTEDFTIVINDDDEQLTTKVHVPVFDYTRLEWWLNLQQLGYLIPILKKLDWTKLKQAAVIARKLSTMQGTEFALKSMLALLDAKDAITIKRKWARGNDIALDDLHSSNLSRRNFAPTGTAIVQYYTNKLDSWKRQVYAKASQVALSIDDIATCLRNVLPATIQLTDWQTVQVALACIYAKSTVLTTSNAYASTKVSNDIQVQSVSKFVHVNVVRNAVSKQLIRYASNTEHCYMYFTALVKLVSKLPVQDAVVCIDNEEFARNVTFDKETTLVITEHDNICVGEHSITIHATTDNSSMYTMQHTIVIEPSNESIDICEVTDTAVAKSELLHGHGLVRLVRQHTDSLLHASCSQSVKVPRGYLRFFLDAKYLQSSGAYYLHINDGLHRQIVLCSIDRLAKLTDFDMEFKNINGRLTCMLTTKSFCGLFDITMHTSVYTDRIDGGDYVSKQVVYLSDNVQPFITMNSIDAIMQIYDAVELQNVKINGELLPCKLKHSSLHTATYMQDLLHELSALYVVPNKLVTNDSVKLESIAVNGDSLTFEADTIPQSRQPSKHIKLQYFKRAMSFTLQPVANLQTGKSYAVYKQHCLISLYIVEHGTSYRLKCDTDSLVFAFVKSGNYILTIKSDFYDKTIQITV